MELARAGNLAWYLSTGGDAAVMTALAPVGIIGGGLAGLSLGIALCKAGVPTKIFEAGDYPRHRVCGEFISGLDDATIEKLEIGSVFAGAGCHRSVTWFVGEHRVGRQALSSPARAISRFSLDDRLAQLFVAHGGELVTQTRFKLPAVRSGWIETSGRRPSASSPWLGLKLHVRDLKTADDLELHLGAQAYVGLTSVEDGWINVCGMFRRRSGLKVAPDDVLSTYLHASGLHRLDERIKTGNIRPGSRCAVAGFAFDRGIEANDIFRLGDACATIPPFTGNGMAMAFTSAALAVGPIVGWARGESTWEDATHRVYGALRQKFRPRLAGASLLHPFLLDHKLQRFVGGAMRFGLLPVTTLYRLLH